MSLPANPLGKITTSACSSISLKKRYVPKVLLPIFFLKINAVLAKFNCL
jgi:hypothetical protein